MYLNVFFLSKIAQKWAFMQYNIIRDSNLRCNVLFINKKEPLSAALSCLTRIDILHIEFLLFSYNNNNNKQALHNCNHDHQSLKLSFSADLISAFTTIHMKGPLISVRNRSSAYIIGDVIITETSGG